MSKLLPVSLAALALAGPAAAALVPGLRSPTGNIRCVYAAHTDPRNRGGLFCTLRTATYAVRLQAGCAGLDWHGFLLTPTGRGNVVCSGGALWFGTPRYVTVAYGHAWHAGPYTCRSAVTGMTCTSRSGHGLFVSRASWRAW